MANVHPIYSFSYVRHVTETSLNSDTVLVDYHREVTFTDVNIPVAKNKITLLCLCKRVGRQSRINNMRNKRG